MEGFTKLRVAFIFALLFGAIYVLLPTVLQEDAHSRFGDKVQAVDVPTASGGADLTVSLEVTQGDPAALAEVIEAHLEAVGVPHDSVRTTEFGALEVLLEPGGSTEAVRSVVEGIREVGLHQVLWSDVPPDAQGEPIDALREALVGQPAAGPTIELLSAEADGAANLRLVVELPAEGGWPGPVLLAVDGVGIAVEEVLPDESQALLLFGEVDGRDEVLRSLTYGSLPGEVAVVEEVEEEVVEEEVVEEEEASRVPAWVLALLPDTKMNLGLDLQGGIDLTLQVELDEAVLSQVTRDLAYFRESAAREGIEIAAVRRHRVDPHIQVQSEAGLDELQSFFAKRMPAYVYYDTFEDKGVETHVFAMREEEIKEVQGQAVEQVLETLRKRIDETGVKEPAIVKKGGGRINVQLPGMADLQAAVDAIGTTAVLEFRLVDEEFDQAELQRIITSARDALPGEQYLDDDLLNDWLLTSGRLAEDRMVLWEYADTPEGHVRDFPIALKSEIILTGNDINNAGVSWDRNQQPYVALEFKPQGANTFCRVTGENVNKRFAIILDNEIRSAPNIRERICGGRASIEMGASLDALADANTLALVLRTGSLNAPVSVGEVRQVGASLGRDAIRSGSIATVIGGLVVFVFMAIWYRTAGLVADISLGLNILLVMALLAAFGATLTLPGFAGLALTIGMAVDANIIIYERIREELHLGQSPRKAVDTGFDKAAVAVLDANITTAIAGVVLFSYGTGPMKGFAVTLLIGIATTLFTALVVARTLLELITRRSGARLRI